MPQVNDDQAILKGLSTLWGQMAKDMRHSGKAIRVGVTLGDLCPADQRQLDFLLNDDEDRQKWERIGKAIDSLNARYGTTVASLGPWKQQDNVGGKISFTRIPDAEDFH